jgi:hypothetical protein
VGVVFAGILRGARLLVGKTQDRFKVREAPPPILSCQPPETVGYTGIEPVWRNQGYTVFVRQCSAAEGNSRQFIVTDYRRERAGTAMMRFDQVEDQLTARAFFR